MDCFLQKIKIIKHGPIADLIKARMNEFKQIKKQNSNQTLFEELCFCLLTANYHAAGAIRIQDSIGGGFTTFPEPKLVQRLKSLGYRFPNTRARYICLARHHFPYLKKLITLASDEFALRSWLTNNILGLGYKEASHFLRNVGYTNLAIIDFHIIDLLVEHNLISRPKSKSLNKKQYLEIERKLVEVARAVDVPLGELDLYLWYLETGKILK
jgi:N-glycosylase/DNA lyase